MKEFTTIFGVLFAVGCGLTVVINALCNGAILTMFGSLAVSAIGVLLALCVYQIQNP